MGINGNNGSEFDDEFGIHRHQTGITAVVKPAPFTRGFETA